MPPQIRNQICSVAWSPSETLVALSDDHDVDVHDTSNGEIVFQLRDLPHAVEEMTFSPDGRELAILGRARDWSNEIWRYPLDGTPGKRLLTGLTGSADHSVSWSHDAKRVGVWVAAFNPHNETMSCAVWRGDEELLVWQAKDPKLARLGVRFVVPDRTSDAALLAFLDASIETWTWRDPRGEPKRDVLWKPPEPIWRCAWSSGRDGKHAFGSTVVHEPDKGVAGIVDLATKDATTFPCRQVEEVALGPDHSWAGLGWSLLDDDKPVTLLSWRPGMAKPESLELPKARHASLSPTGRAVLLAHERGEVEIATVVGDRIDLSEEGRLAKTAAPRGPSPDAALENRKRVRKLADASFDAQAIAAHCDWQKSQSVELWDALAASDDKSRAKVLAYFSAQRAAWLEPRLDGGVVSLREFQGSIPWAKRKSLNAAFAAPALRDASVLHVTGDELAWGRGAANANAEALAKSAHAKALIELEFSGMGLSAKGVRALAASPRLAHLRSFGLYWEDPGASGFAAIAKSFPRVKHLRLSFVQLDAAALRALAKARFAGSLRFLDLSANGMGVESGAELARSPLLEGVEALLLGEINGSNPFGPAAALIAASPSIANVAYLGFDGCLHGGGDEHRVADTLAAIVRSPHLDRVRVLRLDSNDLHGTLGVLKDARLPALQALSLSHNDLDDADLATLLESPIARRLETLDLSWNDIGDAGAARIAESKALSRLEHLHLAYAKIDDFAPLEKSSVLSDAAKKTFDAFPPALRVPATYPGRCRWLARFRNPP